MFLTQILYLNSKRVKIGGEHMEYLNKVLGIEVVYEWTRGDFPLSEDRIKAGRSAEKADCSDTKK